MYTFSTYESAAMRTLSKECRADKAKALLNAILGLAGEAGECADHLKKYLFHGHSLDKTKLIKELGDLQWYITETAFALSIGLDEIATRNIDKLRNRYPDGFSSERSLNRGKEDE